MKKDRLILWKCKGSTLNIDGEPIAFVYIEGSDIYFTYINFDSVQFEIYNGSNNKDDILIRGIEYGKNHSSENITNHIQLKKFLYDRNLIDVVREYKLNQIIK